MSGFAERPAAGDAREAREAREARGRRRVVFLCTGNCCRSPMAEAILRHVAGDAVESHSAGSHPAGFVHPLSIAALEEASIDIAGLESKGLEDVYPPRAPAPDLVIALCEHAWEACADRRAAAPWVLWPVDDPFDARGTFEERLVEFRRVRDDLRRRIEKAISDGLLFAPGLGGGSSRPGGRAARPGAEEGS